MAKAKKIAKEAAGFLPGVGTAMDVASAGQAIASGNLPLAALETASAAVGLVPGVGRVLGKALKFGAKKTGLVKFTKEDILTKNNANYKAIRGNVDEKLDKKTAEELFEADEDYVKSIQKAQSKARKMDDPGKRPFQKEALELQEGKITPKEYREVAFADVEKFDEVEELPTFTESIFALDKNKRAKGMIGLDKTIPKGKPKIEAGDKVMARLDIPAYNRFDVYVPQITYKKPDGKGAESIFSRTMVIQDVKFPTPTKPSFDIARGVEQKFPHATINGTVAKNPLTKKMFTDEEAHSVAKAVIDDDDFMHLGYNPDRGGFFYDRGTKMPVFNSPFVVQIGKQIFAKKPIETGAERIAKMRKMDLREIKDPKTKEPLVQGRPVLFNKGGATMQEQMKFAFMNEGGVLADDGVNRDPVSGNEVPSGSMAKEVRDDVPAMLSEGEYVVPADVVRYHGIDKFEELRDEAKRGLARMEADGRIGGQPVEEQEEFPFPVEELQGFDEGGAVGDTYSDVMGSDFRANQRYGSLPTMGFELRNFTNPKTGQTVVVPFFNGKPMQYIPPDFLESGASTTGGGVSSSVGDGGGRQETAPRDTGMSDLAYEAASKALRGTKTVPQTKPFSEYSTEDFRRYVQTRQGVLGRVMDAIPVVGMLTSMQDNAAREFARRSLIQGKNIATGQPLTNNDAGVLMQVADLPKGRSVLSAIDDFLQGKTRRADGIVIDDTPPIDTELRRTTYEAETPVATQQDVSNLYGDRGFTPETIGEDPAQTQTEQMFPTELGEQDTGFSDATVAEEAKEIIDYAWVVVPGVQGNKKFRIDKKNLHLVGASPNDSARAILATDKHGIFDPVLRKTTGKGNLIQVHSEGPENAKVLSKEELARYSGANVNADASEVQGIIESNNNKIDKNKKGIIQSIRNALDMSAGAATPGQGSVLTGTGVTAPVSLITNALSDIGLDRNTVNYGAILSKVGYESRANGKDFTRLIENNMNYSHEAFKKYFGNAKYQQAKNLLRPKGSDGKTNAPDPKNVPALFNIAYGGINKLGNIEPNDGHKFRGRAYVMLTGRTNYTEVGNRLGVDLINMSEQQLNNWFSSPQNSAKATAAFFAIENDRGKDLTNIASINKVVGGANQNVKLNPNYVLTSPSETGTAIAQPQDVSQFYGQRFDPSQIGTDPSLGVSQPLRQTFVPPQAPTAEQVRLAGGVDAFVKSQLPISPEYMTSMGRDLTRPVEPEPLQDLPVGVSIEADGQFTGTGGLGAVQAPRVTTPIVKRDFLDPNMSMSRREVLSDPTIFTGPAGAGIGPVSEDETLQTGLATDFNRFAERAYQTPITAPRTDDDKPFIPQTDAMLADLQPKVAPTFDTESATRPRRLGMSPGAMGGRQLGMSPGAMGGRAAPSAPTTDFVFDYGFGTEGSPKEEEISDAEYKRNVKEATDKVYDEARKRGDQARDEVLRQGGSVEEAYDAMHTAFTGFDRAGNMVDPNISDPFSDVPSFGAFKEGGLASKPKRTKPKKRNTKKGLGGKMAT